MLNVSNKDGLRIISSPKPRLGLLSRTEGGPGKVIVAVVLLMLVGAALKIYIERHDIDSSSGTDQLVNSSAPSGTYSATEVAQKAINEDLLTAAASDHTDIVVALVTAGADVNARGADGNTPLIQSAALGRADAVASLLALGADVDATNNMGNTALMEAAELGRADIVTALIVGKADIKATNVFGSSAIDVARKNGHADVILLLTQGPKPSNSRNAGSAASDESTAMGPGAGPGPSTSKVTDLHQAALAGNVQKITSLIALGADVNARDGNGRTALMIAGSTGNSAMVDLLLVNGANPNLTDFKQGRTVLIVAAEAGYTEVVRTLLTAGADPNMKDRLGDTAMSIAQKLNRAPIGRLLKQAGVKTPSYVQIIPNP